MLSSALKKMEDNFDFTHFINQHSDFNGLKFLTTFGTNKRPRRDIVPNETQLAKIIAYRLM